MNSLGTPIIFIATTNPPASRHFYETMLGFTCISDDPFAIVFDLGANTLRIQKVESQSAAEHTVLGWEVNNIQETVKSLSDKGVEFEKFDNMPQDEQGVWQSPSGALVAWFKDPDSNRLSLTQI